MPKKTQIPYEIINLNNQNIFINKKEFYKIPLISFLQTLNIKTPHFCFNSNLSIAGNCRMCLIELGKGGKPMPSCAIHLTPGSEIFTNTAAIKKARESVIEFLLLNHPLDCPICDQGGKCDLQDYAQQHGSSISRNFAISKRSLAQKNFNLWIKIILTRCIHCTRCVRFSEELAGSPTLGLGYRGRKSEIIVFPLKNHKNYDSKVLGHLIDLCPVGAITNKQNMYHYRTWEFIYYPSVDISNSLGDEILYSTDKNTITDIVPNSTFNDFISDAGRLNHINENITGGKRVLQPYTNIFKTLNITQNKNKKLQNFWNSYNQWLVKQLTYWFNINFFKKYKNNKNNYELITDTLFTETLYNKWLNNKNLYNLIENEKNISFNFNNLKKSYQLIQKPIKKIFLNFNFTWEINTLEIKLRKLKNFKGSINNIILKQSLNNLFKNKNNYLNIFNQNILFFQNYVKTKKFNINNNVLHYINSQKIQKNLYHNIIYKSLNDYFNFNILNLNNHKQWLYNKYQQTNKDLLNNNNINLKITNIYKIKLKKNNNIKHSNFILNQTHYKRKNNLWTLSFPFNPLRDSSGHYINTFGIEKQNLGIIKNNFIIPYFHIKKILLNIFILNTINTKNNEWYTIK